MFSHPLPKHRIPTLVCLAFRMSYLDAFDSPDELIYNITSSDSNVMRLLNEINIQVDSMKVAFETYINTVPCIVAYARSAIELRNQELKIDSLKLRLRSETEHQDALDEMGDTTSPWYHQVSEDHIRIEQTILNGLQVEQDQKTQEVIAFIECYHPEPFDAVTMVKDQANGIVQEIFDAMDQPLPDDIFEPLLEELEAKGFGGKKSKTVRVEPGEEGEDVKDVEDDVAEP
ncbi:hypothetical protein F5Y18DRAFT_102239 [Xylariaceae sp. FL1019]|nr:hypothetical protein F5Y18DRAFT_102239 [Xylariaceae sp. FL1019]